jgi:hypothetical protein
MVSWVLRRASLLPLPGCVCREKGCFYLVIGERKLLYCVAFCEADTYTVILALSFKRYGTVLEPVYGWNETNYLVGLLGKIGKIADLGQNRGDKKTLENEICKHEYLCRWIFLAVTCNHRSAKYSPFRCDLMD